MIRAEWTNADALNSDTVTVVRCKDCAHASERDYRPYGGKKVQKCKMAMGDLYNDDDFFCAWGERREDSHNDC